MIPIRRKKQDSSLFLVFALRFIFLLAIFAPSAYAAEPPLKIGVASMITPVDAVKYYQEIIDYIGEQIGRPVQMVHRRTYDEMDDLLERGEVNVAFICSAPYVNRRNAALLFSQEAAVETRPIEQNTENAR